MVHLCLNDCFQIYLIPTYMTIGKTETKLSIDGIFNSSFILKSISNFTHFDIRTVRPKISDETNPDLTPQKMLYERVSHSHWSIRVNPLLFIVVTKAVTANLQIFNFWVNWTKLNFICFVRALQILVGGITLKVIESLSPNQQPVWPRISSYSEQANLNVYLRLS